MNYINEKEKKLNIALEELKNLDLSNPDLQKNIENLNFQYYFVILDLIDLIFLIRLKHRLIFFFFRFYYSYIYFFII